MRGWLDPDPNQDLIYLSILSTLTLAAYLRVVVDGSRAVHLIGGAKMGIQGIEIEFLRAVTGADCKPSTWHKKEMAYAPVIGFTLGSRALEIASSSIREAPVFKLSGRLFFFFLH